ncbi:mas-related G-protein coupled receptor member H-like [Bombina bombina]|uniref:mas-related G-protein coupled receptor member H-like n=1 Tax=Bombina bombina TaxID=8345 RepID=UPI00235AF38D|nr:mas-related G-protein coupled receptor member H-like [Bombina bombina]
MAIQNPEPPPFNETKDDGMEDFSYIHFTVVACCIFLLCVIGMLGNGITFWFLCFRIPKNKCIVYIVNLNIADFMYLLFNAILSLLHINHFVGFRPEFSGEDEIIICLEIFYDCAYQAGMLFLLAISIERCLSVLYPIWYHCRRPKYQSEFVCLTLWLLATFVSLLENLICSPEIFPVGPAKCIGVQTMSFILYVCISLPLMLLSSCILLIKVRKMSKNCRPPKLYIIILITVFVFLIATIPVKFMWLMFYLKHLPIGFHSRGFFYASIFCTVFSSSINPYIYFLVGRQKNQRLLSSIHNSMCFMWRRKGCLINQVIQQMLIRSQL